MIRPPPRSTRTDTLFPYTTLFRSQRETIVELKALIPNKAIEFDTLGLCRARVNNQRGIRGVVGIVAIPVSVRRKAGGLGLKIFELREDRKSTRLNSSH